MKDEIKEHMQNCVDREESCLLNSDNTKILLDYITNLQQRIYKARKMIFDNYGLLDKYEIEMLDDILKGDSND